MIDFLCIGAQKAGTTWLIANLKKHPQVWTPPFVKELHYFDSVHLDYGKSRVLQIYQKRGRNMLAKNPERKEYFDRVLDPGFAFTDEWYKHIFSLAPEKKIKGECTPLYSAIGEEGVEHVKRLMPDVKLIYIVRDPLARALSSFRMQRDNREKLNKHQGKAEESLMAMVKKKLFRKRGDYARNIPAWEKHFDPSQILYIPFGSVKSNPTGVMRDVEAHLGLSKFDKYPKLTKAVNQTKKTGAEVDEAIAKEIKSLVEPQYAYLSERFGPDFLKQIL